MKHLPVTIHSFFFQKVSANGFGLMRLTWGAFVLAWMLRKLPEIAHYYTDEGFLPLSLGHLVFRGTNRFTILDHVTTPGGVTVVYVLLLAAAFITMIGWKPRMATIATAVLFFSFQERNLLPLGGGDTVLRNIGFLLVISPELRAFSVERLKEQWKHWKLNRQLLPPLSMSIWPYRLLLWQVTIIYVASGWEKATGTMWWDGTAAEAVFHHPHFARWPRAFMDAASVFSPLISAYTLLYEFAWLLLLIPQPLLQRTTQDLPQPLQRFITYGRLKRAILVGGILFHGGIFLMADVGIFPFAMMSAYLGLLLQEDFDSIRRWLNRGFRFQVSGFRIAVLYDGQCGLCLRSVFGLALLDHLNRLHLVDYHNEKERRAIAPELSLESLDKALHIKVPPSTYDLEPHSAKATRGRPRTYKGFDAFRQLSGHIPTLWPVAPLLHLPGIAPLGRRIYGRISERRKKCTHEGCRTEPGGTITP